ncbi:hypothetical protein EVAR_45712_1 [Eumeta japonica]|uniref:Uncharacterized protein n=1 Tax=Eumeta variegata TaxID=151549 RepID=A0A4C1WWY6_EUMVA|nr:hypothetical protein EVAR_45712_1 [Eumeta japonica]
MQRSYHVEIYSARGERARRFGNDRASVPRSHMRVLMRPTADPAGRDGGAQCFFRERAFVRPRLTLTNAPPGRPIPQTSPDYLLKQSVHWPHKPRANTAGPAIRIPDD